MKRLIPLLLGTALLIGACQSGEEVSGGLNEIRYHEIELPDGRTVDCLGRSGGGLSCDWENAK